MKRVPLPFSRSRTTSFVHHLAAAPTVMPYATIAGPDRAH